MECPPMDWFASSDVPTRPPVPHRPNIRPTQGFCWRSIRIYAYRTPRERASAKGGHPLRAVLLEARDGVRVVQGDPDVVEAVEETVLCRRVHGKRGRDADRGCLDGEPFEIDGDL